MEEQFIILIGVMVLLGAIAAVLIVLRQKKSEKKLDELVSKEPTGEPHEHATTAVEATAEPLKQVSVVVPEPPLEAPLSAKLSKTRGLLREKLSRFFGKGNDFTSRQWDELEESLLESDVGMGTTRALLAKVKGRIKEEKELKELVREECLGLFHSSSRLPFVINPDIKPYVISIVGINGVGKTTTIGKLAQWFRAEGKTVLLGAGDTFRAAAISQLKIWADRTDSQFVSGREGADPGAVAFDSVTAAKARGLDVVLLDTAGRLHTKTNLMDELRKVHRVVKKVIPEAPHETWLVLDGTLGQNSVIQAKEFQKTLELTGVVVTKLDGTAKGGAILAVSQELNLPVRFIGVGEGVADFMPFNPDQFISAILGD